MSTDSIAHIADRLRQALGQERASVLLTDPETIHIASPSSPLDRILEVRRRGTADIEVAFVIPNRKGSPFEQLFSGPVSEEASVIQEVVEFVGDIVNEQVVLAWRSNPLRGGRRFLQARELSPAEMRKYSWGVSWAGRLDWERSA